MKEYKNIELKTKKNPLKGLGQWIITISGNDWIKILASTKNNLIANLQISGFRKGKVPASIAKKHIKNDEVFKNASSKAIKIAYQYGLEQKDLDIQPTNKPSVEVTELSENLCQLVFNFDLPGSIKLEKYQDLAIQKPKIKISQSEIEEQINLLKDRFAVFQTKASGSLDFGDTAVFDFTGTINGQEFPGGKSQDVQLEIGSKRFIPGFEEQMVGMKAEETKMIKVTFPKDYQIESLANKEADFTIFLKEIKTKLVSDNQEELVKDVNMPNINNYQELLAYIKKQLQEQKLKTIKEEFVNNVFAEILKSSEVVVPNSLIDKETDRLFESFKDQLKKKNFSFDEYQKMTNLSQEDIRKEAERDALWSLQTFYIAQEIAKKEKIMATEDEINDYLEKISVQFNFPVEKIKKNISDLHFIEDNIKHEKTLDWLWENNGVLNNIKKKKETKKENS